MGYIIKNSYRSTFIAIIVHCHDETVATDSIYSYTSDIDDGSTYAHLFVVAK